MTPTHRMRLYRILFTIMVGIAGFALLYPFVMHQRLEHPLRTILTAVVGICFFGIVHLSTRDKTLD